MLMCKFSVFFSLVCTAYTHKRRIHNGTAAEKGAYPYQVCLRNSDSKIPFCGGSIINEFYVLTAGHCVEDIVIVNLPPRIVEVVVGATNFNDSTARYYPAQKFILHENYEHFFSPHIYAVNDIALIQIDGPIEFTPFISPIKLPSPGYRVEGKTQVIITGWGRFSDHDMNIPATLQAVNLTVVDLKTCKAKWSDRAINIDDRMICVAGSVQEYGQTQHDAGCCLGDSGGPAVEGHVLIGVISSANSCIDSYRYPHILMNVSHYLPWIQGRLTKKKSVWQQTRNFFKDLLFHD
ncbi:chymotrypsin-2-like [Trichogramma pretiosum]|uniref:chymotrypsin-2-like n=1 Tax=Trichogramma pretiosum TaxID=7493 RepID=UPI000C71C3F5|nr:chymotrypsin-2-like [Trichogramma pretiosum]